MSSKSIDQSSKYSTKRNYSSIDYRKRSLSPSRPVRKRSLSPSQSTRKRSLSPSQSARKKRSSRRSVSPLESRKSSSSSRHYKKKDTASHCLSKRDDPTSFQRHGSKNSDYSEKPYSSKSRYSRSPSTSPSVEYKRSTRNDDVDSKKKTRKEKKAKKEKKEKSKKTRLSIGDNWGKYGIIYESDIFSKEAEFQAWLIEIKNANVETMTNSKRKENFAEFMEDYNTATLPHKKFYNIEKWEKKQEAIRMGENYTSHKFDFTKDEERLRMQHKMAAKMAASQLPALRLSEEQINELTRVNRERVEADRMRKMGLKPKESMGVRYEEVNEF